MPRDRVSAKAITPLIIGMDRNFPVNKVFIFLTLVTILPEGALTAIATLFWPLIIIPSITAWPPYRGVDCPTPKKKGEIHLTLSLIKKSLSLQIVPTP